MSRTGAAYLCFVRYCGLYAPSLMGKVICRAFGHLCSPPFKALECVENALKRSQGWFPFPILLLDQTMHDAYSREKEPSKYDRF